MLSGTVSKSWEIAAILVISIACLTLIGVIGREMFYAANPDKRPKRRKRHRSRRDH